MYLGMIVIFISKNGIIDNIYFLNYLFNILNIINYKGLTFFEMLFSQYFIHCKKPLNFLIFNNI